MRGGPINELKAVQRLDNLIGYLHVLFNKILDTGFFPDAWGEGYIVPLHKKAA